MPAVGEHLTAKYYVDNGSYNSVDAPTMVRKNQDKDFNIYNLTNTNSNTLKTQAVNYNQVITKSYVDPFHQENERSRLDLGIYFFNDSSDLVKKEPKQFFY